MAIRQDKKASAGLTEVRRRRGGAAVMRADAGAAGRGGRIEVSVTSGLDAAQPSPRKAAKKSVKKVPKKVLKRAPKKAPSASGSERASERALGVLLRYADPDEVGRLVDAVRAPAGEGAAPDPELWGAAPARTDAAAGVLSNLVQQFEGRRELQALSVTRKEAADLLMCSEQAVTDHLEAHRLLGFKTGRTWRIPAWQLDADAPRGFLPGLDLLLGAWPGGIVSLSGWAQRPHPDLQGRSPAQVLQQGDVEAVVAVAARSTAAGW